MGTYLHLWTESRDGNSAPWRLVRAFRSCGCRGATRRERGRDTACWYCGGEGHVHRYDDQDYNFFAALAGVRGGEGDIFPGEWPEMLLRTSDDPFPPIATPRGLPDDLSSTLEQYFEDPSAEEGKPPGLRLAWPDGHDVSWVLLSEVETYLANPPWYKRRCFVSLKRFKGFPDSLYPPTEPIPKGYCWVGPERYADPRKRIVDIEEASRLIRDGDLDPEVLVHVVWDTHVAREVTPELYSRHLPAWRSLAPRTSDVRLVFAFG